VIKSTTYHLLDIILTGTIVLLSTISVSAATFSVGTVADFVAAINSANINGQTDTIT
jgi:hypothetical protein